jgi:hypothetical protein
MLALLAIGRFASIAQAAAAMAEPRATVVPNVRTSAVYDDSYARWRDLMQHMEHSP